MISLGGAGLVLLLTAVVAFGRRAGWHRFDASSVSRTLFLMLVVGVAVSVIVWGAVVALSLRLSARGVDLIELFADNPSDVVVLTLVFAPIISHLYPRGMLGSAGRGIGAD